MRAVRCGRAGIELVDVPAPAGEGVRIHVRAAGICGSDLHMVAGGFVNGLILGHEIAGTLDDGTAVAVEPLAPCGHCAACVRGDYNLCASGPAIVFGAGRDGGMADELVVPERSVVPLARGVEARDACLVEPLAVAVHGLRRVRQHGGQRVAVVGGGAIGLCGVAAARASGSHVTLVARHDAQRSAGERLGAVVEQGSDSTFDLVVDAAGTKSALERAVALCRPGGTLLLVASYWDGLELPGFAVALKEVTVVPASMYAREGAARDIDVAAALLASNSEIARSLITHRFPLDAAVEAFAVASDRASGAIKVVLEP
jgi:L-iditol 2-dehydrogenase